MKSTNNPVVKVDRQQGCSCLELVCRTWQPDWAITQLWTDLNHWLTQETQHEQPVIWSSKSPKDYSSTFTN